MFWRGDIFPPLQKPGESSIESFTSIKSSASISTEHIACAAEFFCTANQKTMREKASQMLALCWTFSKHGLEPLMRAHAKHLAEERKRQLQLSLR